MLSGTPALLVLSFGLDQKARMSSWNVPSAALAINRGCLLAAKPHPTSGLTTLVRFDAAQDHNYTGGAANPIPFAWRSAALSLGDPTLWKIFRRVECLLTPQSGTNVSLSVEEVLGDGTPEQIGQVASAATNRVGVLTVSANIQGRFVRIAISGLSTQGQEVVVAPPLSIEYRTRDRMGRTR